MSEAKPTVTVSEPLAPMPDRRTFLRTASAALGGAALAGGGVWWATHPKPSTVDPASFVMPGPFAGNVVEVHHPGSIVAGKVNAKVVSTMLDQGLADLAGEKDGTAVWKRFFAKGDVVGIKVNPVGSNFDVRSGKHKYNPKRVAVITNPETILAVIEGLKSAGVNASDIVVFDRYREQFQECGYDKVAGDAGVQWDAAAVDYDDSQLDLTGYSLDSKKPDEKIVKARTDGSPKVSGYDSEAYVVMDFIDPGNHKPEDPLARRSHLCNIVSKRVNKVVNLCLLKDHASAGVTGALKNMSHGMFNNVARSHSSPGLNQCHMFIPAAVSLAKLRQKVVLHIMEGLLGMYQGGPGVWNPSTGAWEYKSLLVATDPVALDRVAWDILDAKRKEAGLAPLARTGKQGSPVNVKVPEMDKDPGTGKPVPTGRMIDRDCETFDHRQPQHVELAGALGLGTFDNAKIRKRRIELT